MTTELSADWHSMPYRNVKSDKWRQSTKVAGYSPIVSDGSAWRIQLKRESVSKLIE